MIEGIVVTEFFLPIVCLACLCIGYVIKNIIPGTEVDRFIPLIVMICGIFFSIWNFGFVTLEVVVTGALSGLSSTGLYELFDQFLKKGKAILGNSTDAKLASAAHAAKEDDENGVG